MFIGEAPGRREDALGRPFVGKSGALLRGIISGLALTAPIYITNIVKCRPPNNRDPEDHEIQACLHYLDDEIRTVSPKTLIVLGRCAALGLRLIRKDQSMSDARKTWSLYNGIPAMVTYHPAARFRNISDILMEDIRYATTG